MDIKAMVLDKDGDNAYLLLGDAKSSKMNVTPKTEGWDHLNSLASGDQIIIDVEFLDGTPNINKIVGIAVYCYRCCRSVLDIEECSRCGRPLLEC